MGSGSRLRLEPVGSGVAVSDQRRANRGEPVLSARAESDAPRRRSLPLSRRRTLPERAVQLSASADGMTAANNKLGWRRDSDRGYDLKGSASCHPLMLSTWPWCFCTPIGARKAATTPPTFIARPEGSAATPGPSRFAATLPDEESL